jgi:hypothetical protein
MRARFNTRQNEWLKSTHPAKPHSLYMINLDSFQTYEDACSIVLVSTSVLVLIYSQRCCIPLIGLQTVRLLPSPDRPDSVYAVPLELRCQSSQVSVSMPMQPCHTGTNRVIQLTSYREEARAERCICSCA